jgi:1,2-diacylglycerol 3-alpha-glucosyltransferase
MRILMLSDVYFPRVNGVSTSIRTYARELLRLGHEVVLVAPDYPLPHADADEGFEIVRVPARTIFFDPEDRLMRAGALRRVEAALAARPWDLIHVHTPFHAHRLGLRLRHRGRVPVVETFHTHFEEYAAHYLPWLPPPALRWAARALARRLCNAVDHLIVPSEQIVALLRGYGVATPASVLPTGIDLGEFARGDGAAFRAAHGIDPCRPTLVTVSRLAREKNIGFLLEVVRDLVRRYPELMLIVAGEGPDRERLQALVQTLGLAAHVRFVGNLDRRGALLDCYCAGDAFVFASPTETQGLVLIEALALGVPVVSTAVLGTASVLANARGARVVPERVDAFAQGVADVLDDAALRRSLSLAARDDARAWSAPVLVARAEALYRSLQAVPA